MTTQDQARTDKWKIDGKCLICVGREEIAAHTVSECYKSVEKEVRDMT